MISPEALQSSQYSFPYHHIPFVDAKGKPRRTRVLDWGLEYLCYVNHLVELISSFRPGSLLDVGCGDGLLVSRLADKVPSLTGVDLDARALMFARAFTPQAQFLEQDVAALDREFDVVTAIEVLEHIPDGADRAFLTACGNRVKPGGRMVLSVPSVNRPVNDKHYRHYDHQRLAADVAAALPAFTVDEMRYLYRDTAAEGFYKRLTKLGLVNGDISPLRNWLWRHVSRKAKTADASNGIHLIAVLRRA